MRPAATTQSILAARRRFFDEGALPDGLVAAPILRSWQRCASHGLDILRGPLVEPIPSQELRALHERNERLRRLTRPEIESLRADAKLTHSAVILTDASGFVLDMVGHTGFAERAAEVALSPGMPWNEAATGTNAIGAALIEKRSIAVHGAEHFFEPHRILACAAAPIVDPRGILTGVLDMSGNAAIRHVHALGLVRLAVEQIEHRAFDHGFAHCTVLRFHQDGALVGTPKEGILVFEGERLVAANRHALRLTNIDWSMLDNLRVDELFEKIEPSTDIRKLPAREGKAFFGRVIAPAQARIWPTCRRIAPNVDIEPVLDAKALAALSHGVRLLEADIPVFIHGETGSGKEVFARRMHAESTRRSKPFIAVNCAALPEGLVEAELFGYEEGAFTGARRRGQKGLLRQADGGILFLDEIGDMPLALQARILRVLQDKQVAPLGGGRPVSVDFALICATHRPLGKLMAEGGFRQDLYFRVAQYVVELPPLRDHPDRLKLIRTIWRRLTGSEDGFSIAGAAEELLAAYDWPGNFRQLVSTLRALLALAEYGRPVDVSALPVTILDGGKPSPAIGPRGSSDRSLEETTLDAMRIALAESNGNVSRAARCLGIDRSTLYRRLLWAKPEGS